MSALAIAHDGLDWSERARNEVDRSGAEHWAWHLLQLDGANSRDGAPDVMGEGDAATIASLFISSFSATARFFHDEHHEDGFIATDRHERDMLRA